MISPQQVVLWAKRPIATNSYPLHVFKNLSLGHVARSTPLYQPLLLARPNVREVVKHEGAKLPYGQDLGPLIQNNLHGKGVSNVTSAFKNPIKV